ncbi:MAG: YfcE family phosphodiesterase [Halobacteriaceae archaeon]
MQNPDVVILGDSHQSGGTGLAGRARSAVDAAERVLHVGDFTTADALMAYREVSTRLEAVHGNSDSPAVTEQLPAERRVELKGLRVVMTHRHQGGPTALDMWARAAGADLVVWGHEHRYRVIDADDVVLLNPGSHADPRGEPPTHVEFQRRPSGLEGHVVTQEGDRLEAVAVPGPG